MIGFFLLEFLFALAALIVAIIAWRDKNKTLFIIACCLLGVELLIILSYWRWLYLLAGFSPMFLILQLAAILLPGFFIIKYLVDKPKNTALDGAEQGAPVTEEYLDSIINAPDEDIDFEEDLYLK